MKSASRLSLLSAVLLAFLPAFGGTVLTNNLPANTAIVNINATQDGAATYNSDQSLWYHPFNTGGNLLQYQIQPGTYSFRVINPADAARLFPALTPAQTNQIFTAWSYNTPWLLNYLVFPAAAATNYSIPQLFDGDPEWPPFSNATDAYNGSIAHGTFNVIRIGPLGRNSPILANSFTFTNNETLVFVVPDYQLNDNRGGVSVLVSPERYTIDWWTVDGGGDTSTIGQYSLSGTIGQPDAGTMSGGNFTLQGGFWGVIAAVQTPGAPLLSIARTTTNTVAVFWPSPSTGWTLEQNTNSVSSVNWSNAPGTILDNGTIKYLIVNLPTGNHFYRLHKP
jgi:hypothetical protein